LQVFDFFIIISLPFSALATSNDSLFQATIALFLSQETGEQGCSEREKFENELERISKASDDSEILLRVSGSLAFQLDFCHAISSKDRLEVDAPIIHLTELLSERNASHTDQ
jgi:hypothetical protein